MKAPFTILLFVFCSLAFRAVGQNITKKYSLPGFIQLNDSLFVSKYEIDIREYGHFLAIWRKESGDSNFLSKALPNPNYLGWVYWNSFAKNSIIFSELFEIVDKDHMTTPPKDTVISFTYSISNWPVVNVTKEQANLYCYFRTKDYEVFYNSQKKKRKAKFPANLVFRLPSTNEWIMAANSMLDTSIYKFGVADSNQKYSTPVCAQTFISDTNGQSHPFPVKSGQLNKSGIINMCGNVAEFVNDSDFVYGGSFKDLQENCTVTSRQTFTEPKNNIGFRVVAVIRNN